jgi:hypothetical protein
MTFDCQGMQYGDENYLRATVNICAVRMLGGLLDELDYRKKAYRSRDDEANEDTWWAERGSVLDAWMADLDRQMAAMKEERQQQAAE